MVGSTDSIIKSVWRVYAVTNPMPPTVFIEDVSVASLADSVGGVALYQYLGNAEKVKLIEAPTRVYTTYYSQRVVVCR